MTERKLASIRRISAIEPIEDADAIEVAVVDGWRVVVKKGEFKPHSLGIYCEVDSFLPIQPEYEFLRPSSYRKLADGSEGFRLRTIKLRGQVSQGLLLQLPDGLWDYPVGADVTELLGIKKYETAIPVAIAGEMAGRFPTHLVPKTDEERIQNLTSMWKHFRSVGPWYVREKLDGSSITFFHNNGEFGVCSRNWQMKEGDTAAWRIANELGLPKSLGEYFGNIALQGELIGPGIQGNRYKSIKSSVRLFSAWNIDAQCYVHDAKLQVIAGTLGFLTVPYVRSYDVLPETIDELIASADGESALNLTPREGLVFRYYEEGMLRFSFKVISNKFLLKEKD